MAAGGMRDSSAVPNVLTVAGSDSSAGAGIQADLKTFAALRVYGCSAITALTAQNTRAVERVYAVPAAMIEAQMDAVFADVRVAAVKVGLLPTARAVRAVARALDRHGAENVVYDPVMAASTGAGLQEPAAVRAVLERLLPRVTVATPNAAELARLTGAARAPRGGAGTERAARRLLAAGPRWVLATGGDLPGRESCDLLLGPAGGAAAAAVRAKWYRAPRIATRHGHGTGCTLSSALAARLALGDGVPAAAAAAKAYVGRALAAADEGLDVGRGPGPLNHFFAAWGRRA